jgi:hypothetical protein
MPNKIPLEEILLSSESVDNTKRLGYINKFTKRESKPTSLNKNKHPHICYVFNNINCTIHLGYNPEESVYYTSLTLAKEKDMDVEFASEKGPSKVRIKYDHLKYRPVVSFSGKRSDVIKYFSKFIVGYSEKYYKPRESAKTD